MVKCVVKGVVKSEEIGRWRVVQCLVKIEEIVTRSVAHDLTKRGLRYACYS